jgi:hypothetical protein
MTEGPGTAGEGLFLNSGSSPWPGNKRGRPEGRPLQSGSPSPTLWLVTFGLLTWLQALLLMSAWCLF